MEIYIGSNIKRLRHQKNITQEKLAEHLGVSTQAVSKWERNETYPDITMLLPLASYFGVSSDELLGLNEAQNEAKIIEYLTESRRLAALGKVTEQFDLICEAYNAFPNDFRIIESYMWQLNYDPYCTKEPYGNEVHKEELYKLCDRVLSECTLDSPRYSALSILCGLYVHEGNTEKAVETANRFPDSYFNTKNEEIEIIYNRNNKEWFPFLQTNLQDLADILHFKIRNCAVHSDADPRTKIRILQKAVDLINLIYDEGDYGFSHTHLCELYTWIGCRYIDLKEYATAFEYMDKSLSYGKAYDELPVLSKHTSFLVNCLSFDKMSISCSQTKNEVARQIDNLKRYYADSDIGKMDGFKDLIEKYTPYARQITL